MLEIHQDFLGKFETIAIPKLELFGFKVKILEVCGEANSTRILLSKDSNNLLIFFATNHLDYIDGVMVCKTSNENINWNSILLPQKGKQRYAYMGDFVQSDISRLVNDIIAIS